MKVDFDHYRGTEIADMEVSSLIEQRDMQLISILKPEFNKDGNMFCFTYPSQNGLPNNCVQGFGKTPYLAACDFNKNFYNQKY